MADDKTITIKRWYQNTEIWSYIASTVLIVTPLAANGLTELELTPLQMLVWTVGIAVIQHVAGLVMRITSKTVIADTKTIEAVQDADTGKFTTQPANKKGTATIVKLAGTGR